MLALGSLLVGFAAFLSVLLNIYWWVLIARAVISWVNADPRNPIVRFLRQVTDPPIGMIRRRLPMSLRYFPLDIAFLVLLALVAFGLYGIVPMISGYGLTLRGQAFGGRV